MSRKIYLRLAAVAAAFSLTACSTDGAGNDDASSPEGTTATEAPAEAGQTEAPAQPGQDGGQAEMPEPDTEDVPDVVATVNDADIPGEEFIAIYESQFDQMAMQSQMTGEEVDQDALKEQTLNSLIDNRLLLLDAEEQGISASQEDGDTLLDEVATANGLESVDELMAQFEEQGISEEQIREDARSQVILDQLIESLDVQDPSEEELQELYDQAVAQQESMQQGQEDDAGASAPPVPSFEELRPQLEEQAISQAQNQALTERVEQLREDAEIETHL